MERLESLEFNSRPTVRRGAAFLIGGFLTVASLGGD